MTDFDTIEGRPSILVMDDEVGIREGCRRVLEPRGFQVLLAATLQDAADLIQEHAFDVVLLDVMMPNGHGTDLLAPIHAKDPDTVAIIITGYATVELAVETIKAGAYDFISKPFSPDLLLITVNQGLERRRLTLETRRLQSIAEESAELARAKKEAEQLSEFKTAYTFKVAHELRAPVAATISLVRPLLRGLAGELTGQQQDVLTRVEARLELLMEMVNDLLALAATKTVVSEESLEPVALQPVVEQVIDRLCVEAEAKKIVLTVDAPATLPPVGATPTGLDTILSNLLSNAIKYTPEQGSVRIHLSANAGEVVVTVTDTGMGIPAGDLARIGEEFFRAKNARYSSITGTGLGLSMVRELMARYGGSMEISSSQGLGTTVTLHLPAGDRSA